MRDRATLVREIGGAAWEVFFTAFDPVDLHVFGVPVTLSRIGV
jgi:hypothetical protein